MGHHRLIAWIREGITSTVVVMRSEVVGYTERLGPIPPCLSPGALLYPTTPDGMYGIHEDPIYEDVPRTVLDERRASDAAEALVTLILSDERYMYLASELMGGEKVFVPHWDRLCRMGRDRRTRRLALHRLGKAPSQLFMEGVRGMAEALKGPLTSLWYLCAGACFYAFIIYLIWPDSKAGRWIAATVKRILAEATRMIYD